MAEKTEVVVTDVNIKFTSMVVLLVKAALFVHNQALGPVFHGVNAGCGQPSVCDVWQRSPFSVRRGDNVSR